MMISGSNNLVQTILGKALVMYEYWLDEAVDIVCVEVGHYWLSIAHSTHTQNPMP
ncbi:MAG: hypothetical protein IT273_00425 [Chitinophagales bacterium]|nr:hypothetical protein [Chitinophagales bacterium]